MPPNHTRTIRSHVFEAANETQRNNEIPEHTPNMFFLTKVTRAKILCVIGELRAYVNFDEVVKSPNISKFLSKKLDYLFREALLNFKEMKPIVASKDFGIFQKPSPNEGNVIHLDQYRAG